MEGRHVRGAKSPEDARVDIGGQFGKIGCDRDNQNRGLWSPGHCQETAEDMTLVELVLGASDDDQLPDEFLSAMRTLHVVPLDKKGGAGGTDENGTARGAQFTQPGFSDERRKTPSAP